MRANEEANSNGRRELLAVDVDPTDNNVEAIARLERESLLERSAGERISDQITRFAGTIGFVAFHVVGLLIWAAINLGLLPGIPVFDPFPFGILTLIVSTEGLLIAIFILISQNRMSRQADRWAHLSLQVSMLAEQELTMLLRMQQKLCERFDVDVTQIRAEATAFMNETDIEDLFEDIKDKLPEV